MWLYGIFWTKSYVHLQEISFNGGNEKLQPKNFYNNNNHDCKPSKRKYRKNKALAFRLTIWRELAQVSLKIKQKQTKRQELKFPSFSYGG